MSVSVQNISKIYGKQKAVDNISFEVKPGEIVGFLGPNGAGKSTTMKILSCFIPQSAGIATVCGYDVVSQAKQVRSKIGYLPEHNPLYTDMYVKEYLHFMAKLHGIKNNVKVRVDELIALTGLSPERNKKIGQLSKGYRQRVGLAQAMIHDPEVLILDEPTSGLDPNQLVEIRQLIKQIGKNKSVILSTHIMQEVEAICNRVLIINKGQIVADEKTAFLQSGMKAESALIIEFEGQVSAGKLQSLEGVKEVLSLGDNKWKLFSSDIRTLKGNVNRLAVENNAIILSMNEEAQKLEEVFRHLTSNTKK